MKWIIQIVFLVLVSEMIVCKFNKIRFTVKNLHRERKGKKYLKSSKKSNKYGNGSNKVGK
jgi:hypothetical protein